MLPVFTPLADTEALAGVVASCSCLKDCRRQAIQAGTQAYCSICFTPMFTMVHPGVCMHGVVAHCIQCHCTTGSSHYSESIHR
jgi:hypothetical protein